MHVSLQVINKESTVLYEAIHLVILINATAE